MTLRIGCSLIFFDNLKRLHKNKCVCLNHDFYRLSVNNTVNYFINSFLILFKFLKEVLKIKTWIPMEAFERATQMKVAVVVYDSNQQFNVMFFICSLCFIRLLNLFFSPSLFIIPPACLWLSSQNHDAIVSKVIRIEIPGPDIVNLTNPLIIHFPFSNFTNHTNVSVPFQIFS